KISPAADCGGIYSSACLRSVFWRTSIVDLTQTLISLAWFVQVAGFHRCCIAIRRWNSLFYSSFDVVDDTHQGDLLKLTEPGTRSHGVAERALDGRIHGFGHRPLCVEIRVDSGVVGVVVQCL